MYTFWEPVIEMLFRFRKPKRIVEVGAGQGFHTHRMLEYCKKEDAVLYVVEPTDFPAWMFLKSNYGDRLRHIRDYSLDALAYLEDYDAILLDGDHNWYTVYHELLAIERTAERTGKFPLVLLHDVGWPYGRRDMYYFPQTIPEEYRQPSALQGLAPGNPGLLERGGLNDIVHNAVEEFGPRNGVLTAVEDFLALTKFELKFHHTMRQHGLGILHAKEPALDHLVPALLGAPFGI
ncbi:class I SAM-dependent methyltransferase [Cohnella sp. GCM10020058]|uniref:class I SAM-dependent methyltransferase n=1 Tax=Cohnella sp. GCM10020058 TaxID=3317330 RepID=UPI0036402A40